MMSETYVLPSASRNRAGGGAPQRRQRAAARSRRIRSARLLTCLGTAVALVVTSCGSTAAWKETAPAGSNVERDGLAAPGEAPSLNSGSMAKNTTGDSPPGRSSGTARYQNGGTSQGRTNERSRGKTLPPGATTAPPAGTSGPGFTAQEIYIGFAYDSTFEEQAAGAGANAAVGDQKEVAKTVARDLSKRGAFDGRTVVPVFFDVNGQKSDWNATAQAACTKFTEDRRVFAAMTSVGQLSNDTFHECLTRQQVVSLSGFLGSGYDSSEHLTQFSPYLYKPTGVTAQRLAPAWMNRLHITGYFDGGWDIDPDRLGREPTKIGLLYGAKGAIDEPIAEALARSVESALAARGYKLAAKVRTTGAQNEDEQAVLRFRQADITHVIGDGSLIRFLPAAAAQNYYPRYGISSASGPALMKLLAAPRQLNGALGVGWIPASDVGQDQRPGDVSPAETHCRKIMQRDGHPTSSQLAYLVMVSACDAFNFIAAAAKHGGLSPTGMQRGVARMGSMPPASTFKISFPGGRVDGASIVRDLAYKNDCLCFVYLNSKNRAM